VVFVVGVVALGVGSSAQAVKKDWTGQLAVTLGTLPPVVLTGSAVATINGSSGGAHLTTLRLNGGIGGTGLVPVTDPLVTAVGIVAVEASSANIGSGTFQPISGGGPLTLNTLPISGVARICLVYAGCNSGSLELNLVQGGGTAGVGGLLTLGGVAGGLAGFRVSIVALPWTIGTATLSRRTDNGSIVMDTRMGFAHGPASNTSSTALTSGVIQLIGPSQVTTLNIPGNNDLIPLWGVLTLHFVPEPGMLLLLGAGVAGLALIGRSRIGRR
jgi:hypothetical protein